MSWRFVVLFVLPACARTATSTEPPPAPPVLVAPEAASAPVVAIAVATAPPAETPAVDIRHIGMHIGGGPNDDATKAPFIKSIDTRTGALGACWAGLPKKPTVDFGIDALVPAAGGRAKIDRPRSTIADSAFVACAQRAFEEIEFLRPRSGLPTKVSASLRFRAKP
jgi:hypothetical protein